MNRTTEATVYEMKRTRLRTDLHRIETEHYLIREGEQHEDFITLMLEYIGDPDPDLRDGLIYPTFYMWIHEQQLFTGGELYSMLEVLADEHHLFHGIGRSADISVFTRTFTVLVIGLIAQRHREQPFLPPAGFRLLKHSLLRYYAEEQDMRGYLEEGGWAHAAAHGADALDELVQCPESGEGLQVEVLNVIHGMLLNGSHIFCEEEDERIATILDTMIIHHLLPQEQIACWFVSLGATGSEPRSRSADINRVNCKNFLRCVYFRRDGYAAEGILHSALLTALHAVNRFTP
jgi:hypothetical protein